MTFNHFEALANAITPISAEITKGIAETVVSGFSARAARATGHMADESIYCITSSESTYRADARDFPEVQAPLDETTALVVVGAKYGAVVELGGAHQAAQPALVPAAMAAIPEFVDRNSGMIEVKLRKAI